MTFVLSNQVYSNDSTPYPVSNSNPNLVTLTDTQTLTNKTISGGSLVSSTLLSPTISNGIAIQTILNGPTIVNIGTSTTISHPPLGLSQSDNSVNFVTDVANSIKWTLTTVGAVTASFVIPAAALGKPWTVISRVSGYVSAGALSPNSLSRQTSTLIRSGSPTPLYRNDYDQIGADENVGTVSSTLIHTSVDSSISVMVLGVAANTIVWYGETTITPYT